MAPKTNQGQDWGEVHEALGSNPKPKGAKENPCHQHKYCINAIFKKSRLNTEIIQDEQNTTILQTDKSLFFICIIHLICFSPARALFLFKTQTFLLTMCSLHQTSHYNRYLDSGGVFWCPPLKVHAYARCLTLLALLTRVLPLLINLHTLEPIFSR